MLADVHRRVFLRLRSGRNRFFFPVRESNILALIMDISVVIPTWRGKQLLEAYLPSVLAATDVYRSRSGHKTEVVIVEDAGGDGTPDWLASHYRGSHPGHRPRMNRGFCAACQTGFENARYPVVLLLSNDVRLKAECIAPSGGTSGSGRIRRHRKISTRRGTFCNGGKIARFRRGMWTPCRTMMSCRAHGPLGLLSFTASGLSRLITVKFLELAALIP